MIEDHVAIPLVKLNPNTVKVNVKYKIKKEQFINGSGETEFRYFFVRDLAPKIKELILKKIRIN